MRTGSLSSAAENTIMTMQWRSCALTLLILLSVSACGQKGPLFLPGDTRQISTEMPVDEESQENDEEDDGSLDR